MRKSSGKDQHETGWNPLVTTKKIFNKEFFELRVHFSVILLIDSLLNAIGDGINRL